MTTLGAILRPTVPPESLREAAVAADRAGLEELWLWEDPFCTGGVAAMSAALAVTDRLRIGVGILPVPVRNVTLLGMEIATLCRLFPGRPIVGLGHGGWMDQVGVRPASPLTLLSEYTTALRALLAGDSVTVAGRYVRLDKVQLNWPLPESPPLHIGAIGPRTLELAGRCGDGTILVGGTRPDDLRAARGHIEAGRTGAGRSGSHRVTVYLPAATGSDAAERLRADAARDGYDADHEYGVAGEPAAIAAAVRRLAEAGADAVVLQPPSDEPDPAGFVRFAGEEVAPLVAG
jgi:alkanesulfonate monooxygenase SsuD/methylene tetrahydromethanopterin reductase-like flavin-dependent oxidoreductase (luciferase family)